LKDKFKAERVKQEATVGVDDFGDDDYPFSSRWRIYGRRSRAMRQKGLKRWMIRAERILAGGKAFVP
jgi:hypothetical protein